MNEAMNIEAIANDTGLSGVELADELVRRGLAFDREDALTILDVEAGGEGDTEVVDTHG